METALVCGYDADSVLQEKTRTIDDHLSIWGLIELWFSQAPTIASVHVSCYDSNDVLVHEYVVTAVS